MDWNKVLRAVRAQIPFFVRVVFRSFVRQLSEDLIEFMKEIVRLEQQTTILEQQVEREKERAAAQTAALEKRIKVLTEENEALREALKALLN